MKTDSGMAPSITAVSLITVRGTAITRYRRDNSGNSLASMAVALIRSLSIAIQCVSNTADGQWGQPGVTKTFRSTGSVMDWTSSRDFSESPEERFPIEIRSSSRLANSYPPGVPRYRIP